MKKILFLVQLPPPVHGASMMNRHVIATFEKSECDMKTIPLRFTEDIAQLRVFSINKILIMFKIAFKIIKSIIVFKPDMVYFTLSHLGSAFYRDIIYVAILKLFNVSIIYHLHGKGVKCQSNIWWKRYLYKFVFKDTIVIHLSPILEADIIGLGYEKIHFIANGIELVNLDSSIELTNTIPNLLFLSNLTVTKGLLELIEACKILQNKGIDFHLHIVGKEKDITYKNLKSIIHDLGLEHTITIVGAIYGDEKYQILNKSDVFIHPTLNDAFPLVLLEAMQFSLPIIATFEGAIPEIVDEGVTGFLVPKKNAIKLAEKIEILIADKTLRLKMGVEGNKKFIKKYTLRKFEENIKQLLLE